MTEAEGGGLPPEFQIDIGPEDELVITDWDHRLGRFLRSTSTTTYSQPFWKTSICSHRCISVLFDESRANRTRFSWNKIQLEQDSADSAQFFTFLYTSGRECVDYRREG